MITLETIAALHNKWLNVAMKCGLNRFDAEDAVQNMYLWFANQESLDRFEWKDGRVNEAYVLFTVRCRAIDLQREQSSRKKDLVYESESPYVNEDEGWMESQKERERIDHEVEQFLSTRSECIQQAFSKMQTHKKWRLSYLLLNILTDERDYFKDNKMNIAKLARETGISKDVLYNERKKARQYICQECGEDLAEEART